MSAKNVGVSRPRQTRKSNRYRCESMFIIILIVSVPNGTRDGRIDCEHVCVRVGKRKMKKSLVIKVKIRKSNTRLNG